MKATAKKSEVDGRQIVLGVLAILAVVIVVVLIRLFAWSDGLYEVQGTVTRAGQPIAMEGCRITFLAPDKGIFAPAKIGPDGKYRVFNHKESGLPPGTYSVVVSFPAEYLPPTDPKDPLKPLPPAELERQLGQYIPKKYRDPKTSELSLTIVDDDVTFDVDMVE